MKQTHFSVTLQIDPYLVYLSEYEIKFAKQYCVAYLRFILELLRVTSSASFLDQLAKSTFRSRYAHTPFGHGTE